MCFPESVSRRGENQIFDFFEDEMKTSVRDFLVRTEDFLKSDGVLIKNETSVRKCTSRLLYIMRKVQSRTEIV